MAAGLLVGASAWADLVPTTESCDFESSEVLFTAEGRVATNKNAVDPKNEENHVYQMTSATNAQNAAPGAFGYYDFSALTKTASKVDISFDCFLPEVSGQLKISFGDATQRTSSIFTTSGVWGYNADGAIFAFGTERGKLNGNDNENYASVNGTAIGSTTDLKANEVLGLWVSVSATVDVANKKVSYTLKNKSTSATLVSADDADFLSSEAMACTQLDIQTGVNSCTAYVDNVSITAYVDESEKYADYTIKYVYDGTEIKSSRTVESAKVGSTPSILDSDKNPIWYQDEKYIYESDDAETKTVEESGTVVTVTFRKAKTEAYTVNLVNSENSSILVENAFSGTIVEGEASAVYYHKAIKVNDTWYVRDQNNAEPYYGINAVAGTNTVSYTANTAVSYFFEVEDLPVVQKGTYDGWRNDGMATRSSNGQAPRHYGKNYAYTDALAGGIYTLVMNARNQSGSASANVILAIMDEDDVITKLDDQFEDWTKGQTAEKTVSVKIPDGAKFVLQCGEDNSNLNMDFLMFTRTGDYTISTTIGETGYATLASAVALDLNGLEKQGVTAYYVSEVKDSYVVLKEAPGTVAANTGLILAGEGDVTIPVAATGSTISGNKLVACPAGQTLGANANQYVLVANEEGKAEFQSLAGNGATIPAGKAYLEVSGSDARSLSIIFDGETTGIAEVATTGAENGAIYNLSGQRVSQPAQGLYIVNGKKVIIK